MTCWRICTRASQVKFVLVLQQSGQRERFSLKVTRVFPYIWQIFRISTITVKPFSISFFISNSITIRRLWGSVHTKRASTRSAYMSLYLSTNAFFNPLIILSIRPNSSTDSLSTNTQCFDNVSVLKHYIMIKWKLLATLTTSSNRSLKINTFWDICIHK